MKNFTQNICKNFIILLISFSLISSCSYRPILDQNDRYLESGDEDAEQAINDCTKKADAYLKKFKAKRIAKETGRKSVIGGIFGGIFGFLFGGNTTSLITGLAIGTGVGASTGALSAAGEGTITPDQTKQRYVSNCLADKGYSVIGWQ